MIDIEEKIREAILFINQDAKLRTCVSFEDLQAFCDPNQLFLPDQKEEESEEEYCHTCNLIIDGINERIALRGVSEKNFDHQEAIHIELLNRPSEKDLVYWWYTDDSMETHVISCPENWLSKPLSEYDLLSEEQIEDGSAEGSYNIWKASLKSTLWEIDSAFFTMNFVYNLVDEGLICGKKAITSFQ